MMKVGRSWLLVLALLIFGAAVVVPAGWSIQTLRNVSNSVADIGKRNSHLALIHTLLDEMSDLDRVLAGAAEIDAATHARFSRTVETITGQGSPIERAMSLAPLAIPADEQAALWQAVQSISQSWNRFTPDNPAQLQRDDMKADLVLLSERSREVQKIIHRLSEALTAQNATQLNGSLRGLSSEAKLLIVILLSGLFLIVCGAFLVTVVVRHARAAEQTIRVRELALSQQNVQFRAALDNMRHGLTMFGADGRLEIYNYRILEIYGLPRGSLKPGMTLEEISAVRLKHGYQVASESGEVINRFFDERLGGDDTSASLWDEDERNVVVNKRTIRVARSPRADGGYVVMHDDITERQQALMNLEARENELTEQIQRFKDLVEGVPFGLSMFDSDQRLIICNRPFVNLFGLTEVNPGPGTTYDQIVDSIYERGIFSDSSRAAREAFRRSASSMIASSRVIPCSDGRSVLMSRFPRRGGGWVMFHEDVTIRVRVEHELERSRAELATEIGRFKDALDNMGQGLSMYDADERLVVFNRHFLEINKLSERDIKPGIKMRDVVALLLEHKVYDFSLGERLQQYVDSSTRSDGFADIRQQADGRVVQISSYPRPAGGFVVIHNDITERENARRELELSEAAQHLQSELFKDALDNMGYGLNVFDAQGRILVYNKQFLDMTGLAAVEIPIGASISEIIDTRRAKGLFAESSDEFFAQHRDAIAAGRSFEHTQTSLKGQIISSAFSPRAAGGWVVLHSDITDRVRAEESKRRAAEEAEELRRQRHAALAANQAKSAFLAMMSHEIRTPMNAVIGLSSALLDSSLDSEQMHLVDTIHESSNSLLRLLNDILDMSKLEAGKVEFEVAAFSPAGLIDNAVSIVTARAAEKGLSVRAVAQGKLPPALNGDHARLRQVILNLVTNAIKFTESGSIEVAARCTAESETEAALEISVSDTGIGIAPEQLGKLFEEFSQADATINRKFGGTGLGLAISKRIVSQLGGDIWVESTLGLGTKFTFAVTLPKAPASALSETRTRAPDDAFIQILASLERPLRVMLAEDNATNQLVFSKLVQGLRFDLTIAENGREALDNAAQGPFDVVFMDMRMPEMDGLAATRAIRALGGAWSKIPIIALTANAFPDDVKACREAGMNEFMSKPIRKKILIEKLSKLLADHPLVGAATEAFVSKSGKTPADTDDNLPVTPPAEVAIADVAPILDHGSFGELVEAIGADGVRATLDVYLTETVARLELLRRLSCEGDGARIRDEAHTLKGASGTFGLRQVTDLAKLLEHSAHTITPEEYSDLVDRLDACFRLARDEVERACVAAAA